MDSKYILSCVSFPPSVPSDGLSGLSTLYESIAFLSDSEKAAFIKAVSSSVKPSPALSHFLKLQVSQVTSSYTSLYCMQSSALSDNRKRSLSPTDSTRHSMGDSSYTASCGYLPKYTQSQLVTSPDITGFL